MTLSITSFNTSNGRVNVTLTSSNMELLLSGKHLLTSAKKICLFWTPCCGTVVYYVQLHPICTNCLLTNTRSLERPWSG